jgi:diguanylate cyclase (GGDEF)-like protein/putative nucleotidyltransferase with HDIG domain
VLSAVAFFIGEHFVLYNRIDDKDIVIKVEEFLFEGDKVLLTERKIPHLDQNIYEYEAHISRETLSRIDKNYALLVTRLRGNWHQITFNGIRIGEIGSEGVIGNHVWNDAYLFPIDDQLVKADNVIAFRTYSEYKIGFGEIPILIVGGQEGQVIYKQLKGFHSTLYTVVISAMFTLSMIEIILFALTRFHDKKYGLMPITVLAITFYLFDYLNVSYFSLTPLMFKKGIILMLYIAVFIQSIALSRVFQKKYIFKFGLMTFLLSAVSFLISPNMVTLSNVYGMTNLLLLMNVSIWFVESILAYIKEKNIDSIMLGLATALMLVPGTIDVITLLLDKGQYIRMTVYGVMFYGLAILLIAMMHYIEDQKRLYHHTEKLKIDKARLEKALITDELTGLGNLRGFYEAFQEAVDIKPGSIAVLYVDVDKFRPIVHTLGNKVADQIIQRIAEIMTTCVRASEHVFRYGGQELVMLLDESIYDDINARAERVRKLIAEDEKMSQLSGFYPVTVSIGVATYPKDATELRNVVRKAEKANEYAKVRGRNRVCYYERGIEKKLQSMAQQKLTFDLLTDFVLTLAAAIDLKDVYTGKHSEEVSRFALMIADAMELDDDTKNALRMGSLLHDLGKIAIPDAILSKSGRLTDQEYDQIKTHTVLGSKLIGKIIDDNLVIACVRNHHERYDGKGYPDGFSKDTIPLVARVVCVADAYHAMISTRSYRSGMPKEKALQELIRNRGSQFDPHVVDAFVDVIGG